MYMTQSEIVDRYVRRGTSITILAELNATRVDQIREILTDAGVELPEAKKTKQQRIECCYDALDDIEQRIKEHVQEHKAKDHKQEVLELEYTAVVELMRQLSDERKVGSRKARLRTRTGYGGNTRRNKHILVFLPDLPN